MLAGLKFRNNKVIVEGNSRLLVVSISEDDYMGLTIRELRDNTGLSQKSLQKKAFLPKKDEPTLVKCQYFVQNQN